jgi:hypothetical protein
LSPSLSISTTAGTPFAYQITATNNPTSYSASGLPAGLSINTATGLISGTTVATGASDTTIGAFNLGGTGSAILVITELAPPAPVITSPSGASGTSGLPFIYQITATNNPTLYGISALPTGLQFNNSTGLISGTAMTAGTTNATITVTNAGGAGSAPLSIVIASLTFPTWQNLWFTPGNPAISGDTGTPAGDGIPNLLKYALNLNPMVSGVSGLPQGSMMSSGGNNYLALSYTQVISATDLTYIPEVSGDLQTWNSGVLYVAPVSVILNADGVTETVVVQDLTPAGAGAPRFIRLRVTGP